MVESELEDLQARVSNLELDNAALRAALLQNQIYREVFEHAAVGVAQVSRDGVLLEVNQQFCDIIGHGHDDIVGRKFRDFTHEDDIAGNLELLEQVAAGQIPGYRLQKRYRRSDGEVVWADLSVSKLQDGAGGEYKLISTIVDVSARRSAEEHQQLLLGELSHRTRNLLAVVGALARQIARNCATPAEFEQALTERLTGMAASADLLLEGAGGAQVQELIRRQMAAFMSAGGPQVTLSGPPLKLSAGASQALGLALHELATNACKYGALSTPHGSIAISWSPQTEPGDEFHLTWVERGGPPVGMPTRIGFGRKVIERMVAGSLGGSTTLEFAPAGVEWTLRAPLSNLRD